MQFYSTNHKSPKVSFREALMKGQAPDRGLYMPEKIPKLSIQEILQFKDWTYAKIAQKVTSLFIENEIPQDILEKITTDAYNYDVPIENVVDNQYILRLDRGPTASFKDFAARMMARLMQYVVDEEKRKLVILTATSGDTGGAVADAYYNLNNINVVVLYPEAEISERQRKQMTTLGKNVSAIGVDGKFDDCQALVKEAFADSDLKSIPLNSANSINFGRLLPQLVYYFYTFSRLAKDEKSQIIFSVPSGNFGDLMGGIFAKHVGLPVAKFIVAVNENDEFPRFLATGQYSKISPSRNCLSSAMNVGHPSNLARIVDLYGGHLDETGNLLKSPNMDQMRQDFWSISISDELTRTTIKDTYQKHHVVLEPHGAVAWAGLCAYLTENKTKIPAVAFETADPAKFPEQIRSLINLDPVLPKPMANQAAKSEILNHMSKNYSDFKGILQKMFVI